MASGNIPPQRKEVVVRGEGNCFYRAIALWRDEMSDEKHEEIHRLSSCLIEKKNQTLSEKLLFSTNSVRVQSLKSSTMILQLLKKTISMSFCLEAAVLMLLLHRIQQSLFR